jgi:hypothetical protein
MVSTLFVIAFVIIICSGLEMSKDLFHDDEEE